MPGSVHRSPWPDAAPLRERAGDADGSTLAFAAEVLTAVRRAKSDAKVSMKTEVTTLVVTDSASRLAALEAAANDLIAAANASSIGSAAGDANVEVRLAVADS